LRDINEYEEWYAHAHRAPELQVLGLLSPTYLLINFNLLYCFFVTQFLCSNFRIGQPTYSPIEMLL
jgi:hypothetical protein